MSPVLKISSGLVGSWKKLWIQMLSHGFNPVSKTYASTNISEYQFPQPSNGDFMLKLTGLVSWLNKIILVEAPISMSRMCSSITVTHMQILCIGSLFLSWSVWTQVKTSSLHSNISLSHQRNVPWTWPCSVSSPHIHNINGTQRLLGSWTDRCPVAQ